MKLDIHVHTSETSPCGKVPAVEMVGLYYQAGYDGIVITDHLVARRNIDMPTRERVDWYLSGYRAAKAEGERRGLRVLLGVEARMSSGDEDFLVYGVTEDDIPYLMGLLDSGIDEKAFYEILHPMNRFVVIQAHPYRDGLRRVPLNQLDGIEVYNGHPGHNSRNDKALARAKTGPANFIWTSGSDAHQVPHVGRGGMITDEEITSEAQLASWLIRNPRGQRIET